MTPDCPCILCGTPAHFLGEHRERRYYSCPFCGAVFMDPADFISPREEEERYRQHENDPEDAGYQRFVQPLVDAVESRHHPGSSGLDYGSGPGPVAAKLLRSDGYKITTYDPFFDKNEVALTQTYDFIFCSEVAEHFHHPDEEFKLLRSLLKPGGHLYCMTLRYSESIDFSTWYYKNDETHVIFYSDETARWICEAFEFSRVHLQDRLFILQK